ncbi:lipopolysaccharide biosynthesis protein [Microbacterium sp. NPDC080220]|uniref:lipopolysaccharide biosynthesis protein n=1 Tax=Microbacterium sp. NPDC080220 TaxID=3161017 RepID=UPI0034380EB2
MTLVSQWVRFAIQLAAYVVLARLLSPEEFGIVAMVTVVVTFAAIFADLGLSLAALQAQTLRREERSNLFWLNAGAGLACALVVIALSPVLGVFYNSIEVVAVSAVLAVPLFLNALAVQFRVELMRDARFSALAAQEIAASFAGLVLAVLSALAGWSYWALVVQTLTQSVLILVIVLGQTRWRPSWPKRTGTMGRLVGFGRDTLALQLAYMISRGVDQLIIGRVLGADALGYYSRGSQLVSMAFQQVLSPLTRVVLPKISRAEPADFHRQIELIHRGVCVTVVSLLGLIIAVSPPAVLVILGREWTDMAAVVQVLGAAAVFQAVAYIYYWAFLAKARTGVLFWSELPGRLLMIGGSIAFARYGILAVAVSILAGQLLMWLLGAYFSRRYVGLESGKLLRISAGAVAWTMVPTLSTLILSRVLTQSGVPPLGVLLVAGGAWVALWGAAHLSSARRRATLVNLIRAVIK